jgi:hypothetical protein
MIFFSTLHLHHNKSKKKMEKLIASFKEYNIWELDTEHLPELARFVVTENYRHHTGVCDTDVAYAEIEDIYLEELQYIPYSKTFVARDLENCIIGAIRMMQWDYHAELPMEKIFGKSPLQKVLSVNSNVDIWHVGRFAVSQQTKVSCLSLFKQLIVCAIAPVMVYPSSIILAECDSKLERILSALGIQISRLGESIHYLGSETIPINITRQGIEQFFNREYSFLTQKSSCDVERTLSDTWNFLRICA